MNEIRRYLPSLKAKTAEFDAVRGLPSRIRGGFTPLFDVPRKDNEKLKKPLHEYLDHIASEIFSSWGSDFPFFIELFYFGEEIKTKGLHPLFYILENFRGFLNPLKGIPVTGFYRTSKFNFELAKEIKVDKKGVCIRLNVEDMEFFGELNTKLKTILGLLGVLGKECHLLLDHRLVLPKKVDSAVEITKKALNSISDINDWKTVILSASGFTGSLANFSPHSINPIPRTEILIWEELQRQQNEIARIPTIGDYCVTAPGRGGGGGRKFSASIRYSLEKATIILKGGLIEEEKFEQYHDLLKLLTLQKEFRGPAFSPGDDEIFKRANRLIGPGGPRKAIEMATSHHLALMVFQTSRKRKVTN